MGSSPAPAPCARGWWCLTGKRQHQRNPSQSSLQLPWLAGTASSPHEFAFLCCGSSRHVSTQADNLQETIDSGSKGYLDKHRTGVCASLMLFTLPCGTALLLVARSQAGNRRWSCGSGTGFGVQRGLVPPLQSCCFPACVHQHLQPLCACCTACWTCSQAAGPINPVYGQAAPCRVCSSPYGAILWLAKDNATG